VAVRVVTPWIAEVAHLGYNGDVHKHLRRLGRIWIDAPIYFVTTCTKDRKQLLARDEVGNILIDEWRAAHERHGWAVGRSVIMPDHVVFFCRPELDAKTLSEFVGNWKKKTGPVGKSTRLGCRGQRPRLQGCGNANSSIMFFAPLKVIAKNGITFETIPFVAVWFLQQMNGSMLVGSRR
jgi:hypothetical protein